MIKGFNHVTLSVYDLESSFRFYHEVLGLKPLAKRKNKSAYFLAEDDWFAIVQTDWVTPNTYTHLAWTVDQKDFATLADKIALKFMRGTGDRAWNGCAKIRLLK